MLASEVVAVLTHGFSFLMRKNMEAAMLVKVVMGKMLAGLEAKADLSEAEVELKKNLQAKLAEFNTLELIKNAPSFKIG